MGYIRRSSATRLAGWFGLLAVLMGALSVTALALTRGGAPTPPRRTLANALHVALSGPPVAGVSAQVTFDQHLLPGSSSTLSASPLAGATGHIWVGGGRAHLQVRSQLGTTDLTYDGHQLMLWNRTHHVAYVLPVPARAAAQSGAAEKSHPGVPAVASINGMLAQLGRQAVVSGAAPGNIAGRPAYTVRLSPRRNGGLIGALELAWDAAHGTPLRFAVYPRGSSTAAIELTVTNIQYGAIPSGQLAVTPSGGTRIVQVHLPSRSELRSATSHTAGVTGVAAVSKAVGFRLSAPGELAGMAQREVRSVDLGKSPAALLVYGRGLGSVFVLEQRAAPGAGTLGSLPSVSISGASGHELETTLGTLVRFTRGGVTYTVAGSQPAATIVAAAQALH